MTSYFQPDISSDLLRYILSWFLRLASFVLFSLPFAIAFAALADENACRCGERAVDFTGFDFLYIALLSCLRCCLYRDDAWLPCHVSALQNRGPEMIMLSCGSFFHFTLSMMMRRASLAHCFRHVDRASLYRRAISTRCHHLTAEHCFLARYKVASQDNGHILFFRISCALYRAMAAHVIEARAKIVPSISIWVWRVKVIQFTAKPLGFLFEAFSFIFMIDAT